MDVNLRGAGLKAAAEIACEVSLSPNDQKPQEEVCPETEELNMFAIDGVEGFGKRFEIEMMV